MGNNPAAFDACHRNKTTKSQEVLTLIVLGMAILSGCLSRPSLSPQFFTFSTPAANSAPPIDAWRVLAMRQLTIAPPFAGQSCVYRTGDLSYEQDPYGQFLVPAE